MKFAEFKEGMLIHGGPVTVTEAEMLHFARQYDPQATYVSLWLPELRGLPIEQRHTPFMLSEPQFAGLDYPRLEHIPENWKPYISSAA